MREEGQPRWQEKPPWGCLEGLAMPWGYCRSQKRVAGPRSMFCLGGIAGGHSGREKQEGRVQGRLQAGVQQASAGSREQVGVSALRVPLLDTRQGTGQDGWAQGAGAPH